MARKINKHNVPFHTWSIEEWGLFYKELILCRSRLSDNGRMDQYTANLELTDLYFTYPNYSELSRQTGIPRSSIARAVKSTINKFTL